MPDDLPTIINKLDEYYAVLAALPTEKLERWAAGLDDVLASIRSELDRRAREGARDA